MNFDSLRDQVSNLSLYDIKAGVRKVQNAVMNYTEMEAKVREATNNEPWGASSTMMQDIANATFNYQLLNEIMPMIYKRFTEKSAEEWRQIYKALQLLEFLVKNGSERVIDDVRSHMSLIKMLRQFNFIDQNGKDQGLNVRNRSKELTDLLSDVDKIRQERKKARSNKAKYGGVEGGAGLGGGMSTSGSSRYGGFGSESAATYGGSTRPVYGDGGGFGGEEPQYDEDTGRSTSRGRERFDEYDEYDEGAVAASGKRKADKARTTTSTTSRTTKKPEPPKPKEPEVDLFDFGDDDVLAAPAVVPAPASNGKQAVPATSNDFGALQSAAGGDDDDFDDFQSAAPPATASAPAVPRPNYSSLPPPISASSTQFAAPQPRQGTQNAAFGNIFATTSPAGSASTTPAPSMASAVQQPRPTGYQAAQPNYFTSVSVPQSQSQPQSASGTPGVRSPVGGNKPKAAGGDAFASLLGGGLKKSNAPTKGPTIADMAKQKASAGIWGTTGTSSASSAPAYQPPSGGQKTGGAMDDLLG
ncbi:hypothetical protein MBLNU459_g7185t1 [Dothideomycetes sp. NU459]